MIIKKVLIMIVDYYHMFRKRPIYVCKGITHINWWEAPVNKSWFADNLYERFGERSKNIRIYSVFGRYQALRDKEKGVKIFFAGENIEPFRKHKRLVGRPEKVFAFQKRMEAFHDHINKYDMDLVIASCTDDIKNAIRFPYWILVHFGGCYTLESVREKLEEIETRFHKVELSRKNAANISSHDFWGSRQDICDSLSGIMPIAYAGKWRNNTDELWNKYSNDKNEFLKNFRFNICPENMDAKDYVTEKIWDSFAAGCIPVYYGAYGDPEPEIFNRDSFILWSFDEDNEEKIQQIIKLNEDDQFYAEWKSRRIFKEGAEEYVYSLLNSFYSELERLLEEQNL